MPRIDISLDDMAAISHTLHETVAERARAYENAHARGLRPERARYVLPALVEATDRFEALRAAALREAADLPQRVNAHALTPAQVVAAREARGMTGAHDLTPGQPAPVVNNAARLAAEDIALFVAGLRELREMIAYGELAANERSEWIQRAQIYGGTMHAMNARIAGMLDAWGAELEAARKAAE